MAFINNETGNTNLGAQLEKLVAHADRLDILVGFFYFSGVKILAEALRDRTQLKMRALVGMDAEYVLGQLVEVAAKGDPDSNDAIKARFIASMKKILGTPIVDTKAFHERVEIFVDLLESGRLEMRKTRKPCHAKLYIFELDETQVGNRKYWITGSSNFSEPGLKTRDELNVQIGDFGCEEAQEYFDGLWEEAVPLTAEEEDRKILIELLRDCSVAAETSPFEAYFLVLRNYLEHQRASLKELKVDRILKEAGFTKYRYQVDAVAQAAARLDAYGGAIIADVVGLGKSVIGGLLAAVRGRRGIIVCPPGLMGDPNGEAGGWHEYVHKFKLHGWQVWSRGKLGDLVKMLKHDPDFGMVIVDEAHNFRNERTEDYGLLAEACFGKEVVLLTATPFNNRPSDLQALLHLFSPGKQSPFVPGGDLDARFGWFSKRHESIMKLNKAIAAKDAAEVAKQLAACGVEPLSCNMGHDFKKARVASAKAAKKLTGEIRQVMEKIVIRRNRLDLTGDPDYSKEITTLSEVQDPKQQFFELTEAQNAFYDRVIGEYFGENGKFRGAIYHPQAYLKNKEGTDDAQENLYNMLLGRLVERFESSFGAFAQSVRGVKRSLELSLAFSKKMGTFIFSRKEMEKILEIDDFGDALDAMLKVIEEQDKKYRKSRVKTKNAIFYNLNAKDFDGKKFLADVESDIKLMGEILEEIETLKLCEEDPKAAKLVEALRGVVEGTHPDIDGEAGSPKRKAIVFSSFKDTIDHVAKRVEAAFPGRVVRVTGENFGKTMARRVKEEFDASFEVQTDEADILLATDKLSEGFNLNRAGVVVNYDIPWNPTRVIQRVGRINRIGKKVFEKLYIFNFFPTVKGAGIVQNKEIAENKMFAIHRILGEDAKIFSVDEEPTPAALYKKVGGFDDGQAMSFYTAAKIKYDKAKKWLEANHPETLKRMEEFPANVKTAWTGDEGSVRGTYMFRRQGPGFYALVNRKGEAQIEEWTLEDAMKQIEVECRDWGKAREAFSAEFWEYAVPPADGSPRGTYEALKAYKPQGMIVGKATVGDAVQAVNEINKHKGKYSAKLAKFAADVAEDVQSWGTIPAYTVKKMAQCGNGATEEEAADELEGILGELLELRGEGYLERVKNAAKEDSIVVTVEKK